MQTRKMFFTDSLAVLGLFLASCAPGVAPTVTAKATAAPAKTEAAAARPSVAPATPTASPIPAAEQPRYGGILTISTVGDPISLDVHQEASFLVITVLQCAYNGVTQMDPNEPEKVIGDLAKSWEISTDGITYTFHLNENVKFHDGTTMTSEDVRNSFDRQINPPQGIKADRRPDLAAVDRIETPDKDTLKFSLKYPCSPFLDSISSAWMVIYSKAFVEKKGHMKFDAMGTGPYKLKKYSMGISLEYDKNTNYFVKGRPYLDGMVFYIIRDAGTRLAALRTGQVKLSGPSSSGLTPADAEILGKTMPQAVVMSYPSFSHGNFVLNTLEKPWTDARVRKAAHLAIDRQKAVDVLAQGYGQVASYFPGKWGIPKEDLERLPGFRQPKDADIAEAKKLLAEAGYPNGFTAKALVRAGGEYEQIGVYMADQMAKIGIKLDLDVKETAVRLTLLQQGAYNCHPCVSALSFADPANVARYWSAPLRGDWGQNWQRIGDEKIWQLFDQQSRAVDPGERLKIVRELDLKMIDSGARPVVYWRRSIIGMWPEVKNRGKLIGDYNFQKYQDIWLAK